MSDRMKHLAITVVAVVAVVGPVPQHREVMPRESLDDGLRVKYDTSFEQVVQ